ncbi:MAG: hypothetical protein Tsb004_08520 [Allomuricauda sp.]
MATKQQNSSYTPKDFFHSNFDFNVLKVEYNPLPPISIKVYDKKKQNHALGAKTFLNIEAIPNL